MFGCLFPSDHSRSFYLRFPLIDTIFIQQCGVIVIFFFIRFDIVVILFRRGFLPDGRAEPRVIQTRVLQPSALYHPLEKVKPQ